MPSRYTKIPRKLANKLLANGSITKDEYRQIESFGGIVFSRQKKQLYGIKNSDGAIVVPYLTFKGNRGGGTKYTTEMIELIEAVDEVIKKHCREL